MDSKLFNSIDTTISDIMVKFLHNLSLEYNIDEIELTQRWDAYYGVNSTQTSLRSNTLEVNGVPKVEITTTKVITTTSTKTKPKKGPDYIATEDQPKRKKTGYQVYMDEMRPKIKAEYPTYKFGDIAKELGARWGKLTVEEKQAYSDKVKN